MRITSYEQENIEIRIEYGYEPKLEPEPQHEIKPAAITIETEIKHEIKPPANEPEPFTRS